MTIIPLPAAPTATAGLPPLELIVVLSAQIDPDLNGLVCALDFVGSTEELSPGHRINSNFEIIQTEPTTRGHYLKHYTRLVILSNPAQPGSPVHSPAPVNELDPVATEEDLIPDFLINSALHNTSPNHQITLECDNELYDACLERCGIGASDSVIFGGESTFASLGILSTDYLTIQIPGQPRTQRLVKLYYPGPEIHLGHKVALSPNLARNLTPQLGRPRHRALWVTLNHTHHSNHQPALSQSVTLSLAHFSSTVNLTNAGEVFDLLRDYFYQADPEQAFKLGDLIPVQPTKDRTRFGHTVPVQLGRSPGSGSEQPTVWFVLTEVDEATAASSWATGFRIDPKQTRIIQANSHTAHLVALDSNPDLSSFGSVGVEFYDYVDSVTGAGGAGYAVEPSVVLVGRTGVGKSTLARRVAKVNGLNLVEIDVFDLIGSTDALTAAKLSATLDHATGAKAGMILLRNIHALANKSSASSSPHESTQERKLVGILAAFVGHSSAVLVGTSSSPESISPNVRALFSRSFTIDPPNQDSRLRILNELSSGLNLGLDVSLVSVAQRTAALVPRDLINLINRANQAATARFSSTAATERGEVVISGVDVERGLLSVRSTYSATIGAPKIPSVSWDQVGGLAGVKDEILETIQLPLSQPDLFSAGLKKRSGILLYGPPGTGKTLLAKAVATSCALNFFSVKGPELLDMYIGESEANVRRVFERAREAKPCVIFFDELDSVAPKRGNQGDSGGVMDRIVSQLLAELDGMQAGDQAGDVFVIGATNRPDLLDPALLRPGRFDRMLYLGLSQTHKEQHNILDALTREFTLDNEVDLGAIAERCGLNLTGADLYALCSDAMLKAMTDKATQIDHKLSIINQTEPVPTHPITAQYYLAEMATTHEFQVVVTQRHFLDALAEVSPAHPFPLSGCLNPRPLADPLGHFTAGSECFRS